MLPLEGIKVLDLSNLVPGAYCTMILGDMGAEVIKIEPVQPFPLVDAGYSPGGEENRRTAAFFALNRNKRSIGINLRDEEGQKIFQKLAKDADVIVEGYRPGVVKRLGADYEAIRSFNPGIIYCSLSGFGQDGPYWDMPGHDINYISLAGVLGLVGPSEGPPYAPLNLVADFAGVSLYGAIGILLAIIVRKKTGQGQYIDQAYLDGSLQLMTWFTHRFFQDGTVMRRGESWVLGAFPNYGVYKTKDDQYISIGCLEPHFWVNLCKLLGKDHHTKFMWSMETTFMKPQKLHEEIWTDLRETFLTKTRDEWFDLLKEHDIPVGKVYSMDEVFDDPQVTHRKMAIEIDDPNVGTVKQIGILPKLSETPGAVRSLAPIHGENTDELLLECGYSKDEIQTFRDNEIIG